MFHLASMFPNWISRRRPPQLSPANTIDLVEGDSIIPQFSPASSDGPQPVEIAAKVQQAFRPFTMSPVFRVALSSSSSSVPGEAILKFYDRRCNACERRFRKGKPWSHKREKKYQEYLAAVKAGRIPARDLLNECNIKELSTREFEAYQATLARHIFASEQATYQRLLPLQGKQSPIIYGVVHYDVGGGELIPGILIEYIPCTTLRQTIERWTSRQPSLPNSILVDLCIDAIATVDRVSDFDILNTDVRVDNILVRDPFLTSSGRIVENAVVAIDFSATRLREHDEGDKEWASEKFATAETLLLARDAGRLIGVHVGHGIWNNVQPERWQIKLHFPF